MTLSIVSLIATLSKKDIQHDDTKHNGLNGNTQHKTFSIMTIRILGLMATLSMMTLRILGLIATLR
jgi:hypothetical protein